jgi:hypothetical protein
VRLFNVLSVFLYQVSMSSEDAHGCPKMEPPYVFRRSGHSTEKAGIVPGFQRKPKWLLDLFHSVIHTSLQAFNSSFLAFLLVFTLEGCRSQTNRTTDKQCLLWRKCIQVAHWHQPQVAWTNAQDALQPMYLYWRVTILTERAQQLIPLNGQGGFC